MLPLLGQRTWKNLYLTARLWGIVLMANLAGALLFAVLLWTDRFFAPDVNAAMVEVARHFVEHEWDTLLLRAIVSGWLIATVVWLLPVVEGAAVLVIVLVTYVMGLASLTHVVAGATDTFLLSLNGHIGWGTAVFGILLPTLIGNVIGGTALFSLLSYGQVKEEL